MPTKRVGSRLEVWKGKARQTSGGLKKDALKVNKRKKIVSKKASAIAHGKSNLRGFLVSKGSRAAPKAPKVVPKKAAPKIPRRAKPTQPPKKSSWAQIGVFKKRGKYERESEEAYRPGGGRKRARRRRTR